MSTLSSTLKLTLLSNVEQRAKAISRSLDGMNRHINSMSSMSRNIAAFGLTYLGIREATETTVGAALSFESAFADVKKVVDATDGQLEMMAKTIRKLSTVIPVAANDLAALYAAGASSGIATEDLNQFAEMAARVGVAFDMPMELAGESLAKLKTQLGLSLSETGDLTDVINHLGNTMASKESDITAFMLRVGALGKLGGLAKEEIAALGSSMIAAGAEPETAATALQNVVKAMTRGSSAKKAQKDVAKALGLNLPALAKDMQKDAPGAIKKVLAAIAKQPKDRHISLLSDFFGDEAKAFAPLVGNIKLLDDALDSVADKTKYAGSAYKDYLARANTTGNVLAILSNKFAELGRSIGDDMLPGIKEGALAIGSVIDSLGERATIFDQLQEAVHGFSNGLGLSSGIKEAIEGLADLLLGVDNGSEAADKLGRIFARFQTYGQQFKGFADGVSEAIARLETAFNLKPGTIGDTLGTIAGYGATLGAASIGIGLAAAAISALGRALWVLSGGALVVGGAKGLAKLFGALKEFSGVPTIGGDPAKNTTAPPPGKKTPDVPAAGGWFGKMGTWLKGIGIQAIIGSIPSLLDATPGDTFEDQVANQKKSQDALRNMLGMESYDAAHDPTRLRAEEDGGRRQEMEKLTTPYNPNTPGVMQYFQQPAAATKTAADGVQSSLPKSVTIDASSISAMVTPRGVQQVAEVNKQPRIVNINLGGVSITGIADLASAASSAAAQLGEKIKSAVESTNSD